MNGNSKQGTIDKFGFCLAQTRSFPLTPFSKTWHGPVQVAGADDCPLLGSELTAAPMKEARVLRQKVNSKICRERTLIGIGQSLASLNGVTFVGVVTGACAVQFLFVRRALHLLIA